MTLLLTDTLFAHEPMRFRAMTTHLRGIDPLAAHARMPTNPAPRGAGYLRVGNVGVVDLRGTMTKYPNWLLELLFGNASTLLVGESIKAAAEDETVENIVLRVDSGGGSSAGVQELGDLVHRVAAYKPVTAVIEDVGASAAYWVASQATRLVAHAGAVVGSIGVYSVVEDWSRAYSAAGVQVHVVKAGDFKGLGVAGVEVTEEALAELRRTVNSINDLFLKAVSRGRALPMDRVRSLADGRVHLGAEAKRMQLVDGIGTADQVVAALNTVKPRVPNTRLAELRAEAAKLERDVRDAAQEKYEHDRRRMGQAKPAHAELAAVTQHRDRIVSAFAGIQVAMVDDGTDAREAYKRTAAEFPTLAKWKDELDAARPLQTV